ncbi:MAG TPA: KGG domain-containing protein [Steroidobacteraceae bacterium]|nr:KGG domain-containing protein [Steroidobacteraceae bacterium]
MAAERRTSNRGFASMDEEKQRRIASKGGRSVPNEKRSFSLNRRLAAEAGRKGGQASHAGARKRATGASSGTSSR